MGEEALRNDPNNGCGGDQVKTENGFCVVGEVREMTKNRRVLCKQYASTGKRLKSPNVLLLF